MTEFGGSSIGVGDVIRQAGTPPSDEEWMQLLMEQRLRGEDASAMLDFLYNHPGKGKLSGVDLPTVTDSLLVQGEPQQISKKDPLGSAAWSVSQFNDGHWITIFRSPIKDEAHYSFVKADPEHPHGSSEGASVDELDQVVRAIVSLAADPETKHRIELLKAREKTGGRIARFFGRNRGKNS